MSELRTNLASVQARISKAASRTGRFPSEITLVAVTKTQRLEVILEAYELGLRDFGENRVEEAEEKVNLLPADIRWHMIGHIQSRKTRRVPPLFQSIHSIDSVKLARRLDNACKNEAQRLPVFIEFNVSGETSKYGFAAHRWDHNKETRDQIAAEVREVVSLPHLRIQGLMTMAPIVSDPELARPTFVRLRRLRDALAELFPEATWEFLSMGMTDDYEVAIEEGSTHVRVGRAIFAPDLEPWRKP